MIKETKKRKEIRRDMRDLLRPFLSFSFPLVNKLSCPLSSLFILWRYYKKYSEHITKEYRRENEGDEGDGAVRCTYRHSSLTSVVLLFLSTLSFACDSLFLAVVISAIDTAVVTNNVAIGHPQTKWKKCLCRDLLYRYPALSR